jgi:hypothetical protein
VHDHLWGKRLRKAGTVLSGFEPLEFSPLAEKIKAQTFARSASASRIWEDFVASLAVDVLFPEQPSIHKWTESWDRLVCRVNRWHSSARLLPKLCSGGELVAGPPRQFSPWCAQILYQEVRTR